MKKVISILLITLLFINTSFSKEGMWLPMLLGQLNEAEMKEMGMKITAEDIFSINQSSLKDAIVHFGGGCTGEIISDQGLLLTNHHCGYGQIQFHSSVEKDYLINGFWAKNNQEELACPGLFVTFIVNMVDVTSDMDKDVSNDFDFNKNDSIRGINKKNIEKQYDGEGKYKVIIKPFFSGNKYYAIITETFNDIRLVGAPPSAVGKFGGDTDNWMWPRHTGDFSLFRIYANKDNEAADFSEENIPYTPKKHFPINMKGVNEGDFTFVFGFPGRTEQYIPSFAVNLVQNVSNPIKIDLREKRLAAMDNLMKQNDEVRIKYAAKYARVSNYHKKWIGENRGLKKLNAIEVKREHEKEFIRRAANTHPEYVNMLKEYEDLYILLNEIQPSYDYFTEGVYAVEFIRMARSIELFNEFLYSNPKKEDIDKKLAALKKNLDLHFKDYDAAVDKSIFNIVMPIFREGIPKVILPNIFNTIDKKYKGDISLYANHVFSKSILVNQSELYKLLENPSTKTLKKLDKDPGYALMMEMWTFFQNSVLPGYKIYNQKAENYQKEYMKALMEVMPEKKYYPDANSTLRVTYGKVEGYFPADGAEYKYFTTSEGILEKYDPNNVDFEMPLDLVEILKKKDFGDYAYPDGTLRVCFLASNHTTGGNSGSPVIDANGYLIGTNFDRTWESTMSDIMFDPERCRNVTVDIKYTLFIIDKYAGAGYLLDEMTLMR
jgi:hypothetical protein